jgi:predicted HTH transcriptional regulator
MLPNQVLLALACSAESQYLERKVAYPGTAEVKKIICAFANSTPEGQYSVLFIGISDDGIIVGLPAVPQVFEAEGKKLLAVIVEHNKAKPHFTGHAYRRRGLKARKPTPPNIPLLFSTASTRSAAFARK